MDAAASLPEKTTRPGLLLDHASFVAEETRRPALTRLEELIGTELAHRLVFALASRLRG